MIMNSYREYADLASANLNDAAHRAAHRPDDQLQVSIANAHCTARSCRIHPGRKRTSRLRDGDLRKRPQREKTNKRSGRPGDLSFSRIGYRGR
jgi:hypothetical protein